MASSGYTIGMPFLKLNNVGRRTKKCGSFSSVAKEALEEREGVDPAINPLKTVDNIYFGYRSARELMEYSEKHIAELSEKQKAAGRKAVRKDAVVMVAGIIKPPKELMQQLTDYEQESLLKDALEQISQIVGHDNIKAAVIHTDERVQHLQFFFEPMTSDERLCAKDVVNLKFFSRINREVPEYLRSCGWKMVKDCKAYDAAEEELLSAEEREKRFLERTEKNGRNTAAFISDTVNESFHELNRLERNIEKLEQENKALSDNNDFLVNQNQLLQEQLIAAEKNKLAAEEEMEILKKKNAILQKKIASLDGQILAKENTLSEVGSELSEKEELLSDTNRELVRVDTELLEKSISLSKINSDLEKTDIFIAEQKKQLSAIAYEVLDRREYNAKAKSCWDVLERLRTILSERYDSLWPFRNRKAEKAILEAVSDARDYIMAAIFALAAFEKNSNMPEEERVSSQIERGLHKTLAVQIDSASERTDSSQNSSKAKEKDEMVIF